MSGVGFLEKLVDVAEVEWRFLEDVFNIYAGGDAPTDALSDSETEEFNIPILSNGIGDNSLYGWTDKAKIDKPSLTISARGTIGWTSYRDRPFFPIVRLLVLTPKIKLNLKYAYYFMKTIENGYKIAEAGIPQLTKPMLTGIKIPLPCPGNPKKSLAIQGEIVRILDTFTELTAKLTVELAAELEARKKQYNYYRNQLLSFGEGDVEWNRLGEVAKITVGEFVRKDKQNKNAKYPVYNGGRAPTGYYEEYNNDGEKIVVSARGANAGFVNKSSAPYWAGNSCYSISVQNVGQLHWMYAYYYLKHSEAKLTGIQQKGGIPALSKRQMEEFLLPIPALAQQARIVAILDKYDALTNSISEGLPREIELRQRQYAYNRNQLLSFPKPEGVEA